MATTTLGIDISVQIDLPTLKLGLWGALRDSDRYRNMTAAFGPCLAEVSRFLEEKSTPAREKPRSISPTPLAPPTREQLRLIPAICQGLIGFMDYVLRHTPNETISCRELIFGIAGSERWFEAAYRELVISHLLVAIESARQTLSFVGELDSGKRETLVEISRAAGRAFWEIINEPAPRSAA